MGFQDLIKINIDSPGIIRDKTMNDKLMYIPNDNKNFTPSVDLNSQLKRLDTIIFELTDQN